MGELRDTILVNLFSRPLRLNRHAVVALLVAAVGLILTEQLAKAYLDQQRLEAHDRTLTMAAQVRSRLESSLNSTVFLAHGLVAYVASIPDPTPAEAQRALKVLYESDRRIRNVGLAPANVIRYVYPLKGNERALGLRYEEYPDQWPDVARAISSRQSVLAGPVDLAQGGRAIISRTPVFLDDGSYWGLVSTVIDIEQLERDVALPQWSTLRYVLFGHDAGVGAPPVFGDASVDGTAAIRMAIEVPGGQWTLVAARLPDAPPLGVWVLRGVMGTMSLLLGLFMYLALAGRARAQALASRLAQVNQGLERANQELLRLSQRDPLTQLLNRRAFEDALARAWQLATQQQTSIALLVIDIDHFKSINDRYGHAAGDRALVDIARAIRSRVRDGHDLVVRHGGEEFVVMAAGLAMDEVVALAERIRAAAAVCRIRPVEPTLVDEPITVSIGAAVGVPGLHSDAHTLLQRADDALYRAKRGGRNQVAVADVLAEQEKDRVASPGVLLPPDPR